MAEGRPSIIVSAIGKEGQIIETVYRSSSSEMALVIAQGSNIQIAPKWATGSKTYVPINPSNNLIRNNAVLLPSEPAEYGSTQSLITELQQYIARYVSLSVHALGISAAYVLLSWVYDAFNELPYLRFRGDYGTGKTRALIVVGSLCYKSFLASGASTVSPIFHTLDTFRGTLVFDEADFRFTDEKAELVKILNNGNAKGFPVLRTCITQQREFNPQAFVIFGPKIVGMRRSYDDKALESRFLTIEMETGRSAGVPINLPDEQKGEALLLRNKLLMYRLRTRPAAAVDPTLADPALEARINQILLPLLSVIPDRELRTIIRRTARATQENILTVRSVSAEGHALSIAVRLAEEHPQTLIGLSEIATAFMAHYGAEYDRPITNRWVGALLRRLGLILYKSNGVFVVGPNQEERLKALCTRYGVAPMSKPLDQ